MGKTFAHLKSAEAKAKVEQRQQRQRLVALMCAYGPWGFPECSQHSFNDLTVSDLIGLDYFNLPRQEG